MGRPDEMRLLGEVSLTCGKRMHVKVPADYICEHGMPQPWATCTDCMLLPHAMQPQPPRPEPAPPKPKPARKARASRAKSPEEKAASARARTAKPRISTRLPKSVDDDMPPLTGTKDLAYEIPGANLRYHVQGADKGWLPISSLPKDLRDRGWIYLQTDAELVARCQVKGVGFRDKRWTHERAETTADAGPGPTLELEGDHWQFLSIDLGPDGEVETPGYRYVITDGDAVSVALPESEASGDGSSDVATPGGE